MIEQEKMYCTEKAKEVDILVERTARKKEIAACNNMLYCEATTFCRFVNPLTTRNPLKETDSIVEV